MGPVLAVGAVVVRDGSLLMVQRGQEPAKGLWTLPGGRVEQGEMLTDAVAREVKEETGIDIEVGDLLGILEVPGEEHFVILDYVATVAGESSPTAKDDAADVRWVPLDEVDRLECTPRFIETMNAWGVLGQQM